jgi:signal transduction histidine kinase
MKSFNRLARPDAHAGVADTLRRERRLLDEIGRDRSAAITDSAVRLEEARRQTDLRLAGDLEELDEALLDRSRELLEERRARESAETALAERERLLAMFGHDLSSFLSVLAVNAELSLSSGGKDLKSLKDLQRSVRRLELLASNLLDCARLKTGTFHVVVDMHDASEVIREAVEMFRPLALAKSVSLAAALPGNALPVRIDADRIFQVLSNLFSNAIKVTPSRGTISVSAERVDDAVRIAVRDSGRGIPKSDLERIFEPYCRLGLADRLGLGLGLYIAKSAVHAHGGRIWAESKPGSGSTFFFTVPALDDPMRENPSREVMEALSV